jgi:hypothetical protein
MGPAMAKAVQLRGQRIHESPQFVSHSSTWRILAFVMDCVARVIALLFDIVKFCERAGARPCYLPVFRS